MSTMGERFVLERTVTTEKGRTVLRVRKYSGILDAEGKFHLRGYCGKYIPLRQGSGKKNSEAA